MRFFLEPISGPEIEPVTLTEMKSNLRTFDSSTGEDDLITGKMVAAREWVEDFTGRALIDQTWRLTVDQCGYFFGGDSVSGFYPGIWPGSGRDINRYFGLFQFGIDRSIRLRKSPALAITSFVSVAADGTETTIAADTYELREPKSKWPSLMPLSGATWISGTFRITFRAGYAERTGSPQQDASVIPNRYKQAIMLYTEALYDRDPVMMQKLMDAAEAIIRPERCELGMA